ncbi:DUF6886 family protein [Paenibacillus sp. OV219]|uniref:DUF6886 family protein n=1 Tax=Paenibacillus sp. OV219 TaxID=1884377 RepID=UPI0008BA4596|nr:DUF6886 family protein [Paenibacillus sp. OV219]SEM88915.1 hypothetical protein SAMN05518847_1011062 [Paenibacillus sp. OV219]
MLYHFSEDPNIKLFTPRQLEYRLDEPAMVWAIDAFYAVHYYFPRDCPRICLWPMKGTTAEDRERFFGLSCTERLLAIESAWLDRLRTTVLYRYRFDDADFELYEANAGYYTATKEVKPVSVERMDDLLQWIVSAGVELRVMPSLQQLRDAVLTSTVNFSMIRMKNARST